MRITFEQIGRRIQQFFKSEEVEKVARETRFVQRTSKLTGTKFLQALVFNVLEKGEMTLSSIGQSCLDLNVSISEQGIDERLNEKSVKFLRAMSIRALEHLRHEDPLAVKIVEQFSNVYLVDSSQFSLPENMSNLFAGVGGCASKASMKMQLVFDYLHGCIAYLDLCDGKSSDQGYRGHWTLIKQGSLFMMDLGYFVLDTFKEIHDAGGYFLSRFQTQTALSYRNGERIELLEWLQEQTETLVEQEILLGGQAKHQIPCRLIAYSLNQELADRRRQTAKESARRQGRTASQRHLKLLDWSIYVTNVSEPMLRSSHVASLYRIRWQIELIFKMAKSFFALAHIASLRSERILSEFYARLIALILTYFLIAPIRLPRAPKNNREISPIKVRIALQRFARFFSRSLHDSRTFITHIHDFFQHVEHFGFKQKRRKSPNSVQLLTLISTCYDFHLDDPLEKRLCSFSLA